MGKSINFDKKAVKTMIHKLEDEEDKDEVDSDD